MKPTTLRWLVGKDPHLSGPASQQQGAHESLELDVELRDDVIRAPGEADADPEVVLDSPAELASNHGEDVVLLLVDGVAVVDEPDAAVGFDARRQGRQ